MVTATKKRKARSDPGRAKRVPGWEREVLLEKAHGMMSRLSDEEVAAALPVLERYAQDPGAMPESPGTLKVHPPIPFKDFAEFLKNVNEMLSGDSSRDFQSVDACDLACFVHNRGSEEDEAEAVIGLMPIVNRVFVASADAREAEVARRRAKWAKEELEKLRKQCGKTKK